MVIEILLFAISIAAVISSVDFISKSIANFANYVGIPNYLVSTIILSFVVSSPVFLTMLISNIFNVPILGISTIIGFSLAVITLVMGVFLIKNKISVEYERYRNATFMWAASLLFFVVSIDKLIDRADAIFLIGLFIFYCIYIYYRTKRAKEYVYLKTKPSNVILFLPAIIAISLSTFAAIATISMMSSNYLFSVAFFSMTIFSLLLVLPLFDIIKSVFKTPILTFDSLLGSVVVTLTLIPGIVALINPIPYELSYKFGFLPIMFLSIVCLSFALATRLSSAVHKKTGVALISLYILFLLLMIMY